MTTANTQKPFIRLCKIFMIVFCTYLSLIGFVMMLHISTNPLVTDLLSISDDSVQKLQHIEEIIVKRFMPWNK